MEDPINGAPTLSMDRSGVCGVRVSSGSGPDIVNNILIIKFFIDPITSQDDKVIIIPYFKTFNIRSRDHTVRVSSQFC